MSTKAYRTRYRKSVGPRAVGGRYLSGYWGTEYTILAIDVDSSGWMRSITVRDDDGERTHATHWDARRDRVVVDHPSHTEFVVRFTDRDGDTCAVTQPAASAEVAIAAVAYAYGHLAASAMTATATGH